MALVTISASYGAGGSRVGPEVARRLGVTFVDRAVPRGVAERLAVPLEQALAHDESVTGTLGRLLRSFAPVAQAYGGPPADLPPGDDAYREATEAVLREVAAGGEGVILGRAGMVVLAGDPRVLRVRLDGPRERRVEQAMHIEGVDRETAQRRLEQTDRAREAYVRHFYGVEVADASLYHLVVDATTIGLDACAALIVEASRCVHGSSQDAPVGGLTA
jgi:cytidylate kinase